MTIYKPAADGSASTANGSVETSYLSAGTWTDIISLPLSGTYTIYLNPQSKATGSITLQLYAVPADASGSITIGGPAVTVTTTVPGQNASLTFSGTAGQQATVHATGNTMGCETTSLLKPDGSALTSVFSCSASSNLVTQTLPTTGSYSISVNPSGINFGSISLTITSP